MSLLPSVNDAGDVSKDGEPDVDEKVRVAASLEEDSERWEEDGEKVKTEV